MTIEIVTPTETWRALTMADLPHLVEIFSDWQHDERHHFPRSIEKQLEKWVLDMIVEQSSYPIGPDALWRESLICFDGTDALCVLVYLVRGANDPHNAVPLSTLKLEIFAIAPQFRSAGRMAGLMQGISSCCWDHMRPDLIIGTSADTRFDTRLGTVESTRSFTKRRGQQRADFVESRANHDTRIAANPADDISTTLNQGL